MTLSPSAPVICVSSAPSRPAFSHSAPRRFVSRSNLQVQRNQSLTSHSRFKTRKSFIALLLPALFPVSPLLHYSYKKMGVMGLLVLPTSNLELPTSRLRPYPPLPKSFRINNVTNLPQKAPLSNSFRFNCFQTPCKSAPAKSFRLIAFQKQPLFSSIVTRQFSNSQNGATQLCPVR